MARVYGEIPGVPNGTIFEDRRALHDAGVHRPLQAGISGSPTEGADSVVVSGGYEDDDDRGDVIIYTGHGGNDPASGKQVADQDLDAGNRALAVSQERGYPIRVIRGSKGDSPYAPSEGFRYDGLYDIKDFWQEAGKAGFRVYRFELARRPDQEPLHESDSRTEVTEVAAMHKQRHPLAADLPRSAATHIGDVSTSLMLVVESVDVLATDLGQSIQRATQDLRFEDARRMLGVAEQLASFKSKVEETVAEWDTVGRRSSDSARTAKSRGPKKRGRPRKVSPNRKTSQSKFLIPILEVLAASGGSAKRTDVLEGLEERLRPAFKQADLQPVPSGGDIRWINTASWARTELVQKGYMLSSSPKGLWEISDAGRDYLEERSADGV